jgi:hypothetical protein
MKATVYIIKHPNTNEVVYVGQTTLPLKQRLRMHSSENGNERKYMWFKAIRDKNLRPVIEGIEETTTDNVFEREAYWIKFYKNIYPNLLNGENHRPLKYGEETVRVNIRVPKSERENVLNEVRKFLERLSK